MKNMNIGSETSPTADTESWIIFDVPVALAAMLKSPPNAAAAIGPKNA
jgi:hypothetical protein